MILMLQVDCLTLIAVAFMGPSYGICLVLVFLIYVRLGRKQLGECLIYHIILTDIYYLLLWDSLISGNVLSIVFDASLI